MPVFHEGVHRMSEAVSGGGGDDPVDIARGWDDDDEDDDVLVVVVVFAPPGSRGAKAYASWDAARAMTAATA
jgi:hypothetical protein